MISLVEVWLQTKKEIEEQALAEEKARGGNRTLVELRIAGRINRSIEAVEAVLFTYGHPQCFIIVKHSSPEFIKANFGAITAQTGFDQLHSASYSYRGKQAGLRDIYYSREAAEEDLKKIIALEPDGGYDIQPLAPVRSG